MSWGHARSKDLINWEELPVAILEQSNHAIFSGSVVYDDLNNRLVAIYSGHREGNQSQYLSFSHDGGLTWFENLKVLDLNMADFRDPKVFKYQDRWIMSVAKSKEFKVAFFESKDLINWNHLSDFHSPEMTEIYECPDLFELDGKWVLLLSTNPGGAAGGSGMHYLIGQFNGKEFISETKAEFLDYGPDYYAAVTFNGSPERISIGWMNNWLYANNRNLEIWNGSMSAARKLKIENGKLIQTFVGETETFHTDANDFEFKYSNGSLKIKRNDNQLIVDRSELWDSEITTFSIPATGPLTIKALFDAGSIELEVNGLMATALINVGEESPSFRPI